MDNGPVKETPTAEEQHKIFALVDAMHLATSVRHTDPTEAIMMGMVAGAVFAGTQFGMAMAIGLESGDKKRQQEVMMTLMTNFQAGIKAALAKANRIANAQGEVQ